MKTKANWKLGIFAAFLLTLSIGFVSCDPKEEEEASIVGKWGSYKARIEMYSQMGTYIDSVTYTPDSVGYAVLDFRENGQLITNNYGGSTDTATYKVENKKLYIYGESDSPIFDILILNSTDLKLYFQETQDGITSKITMQLKRL